MARETKKTAVKEEAPIEVPETEENVTILEDIAEDMNKTMGLEPPIDVDDDDLLDKIKLEAAQVLAADKKAMAPATWEFLLTQGFLTHLDKKGEAPAKPKNAAKPAAAKPAAEPAKPRYSRVNAIADAIKAGKPTAESIEKFYVDNGGKANLEQAVADINWIVKLLSLSGGITLTKDGGITTI